MAAAARLALALLAAGPLYHALVRASLWLVISRYRAGDTRLLALSYAKDVRFRFPGDSSWACELDNADDVVAWVRRFVDSGLKLYPEAIIVDGPPWNTRIAVVCHDDLILADGTVIYENRAVITGRVAWGKLREYEVLEDTKRADALDAWLAEQGDPKAMAAVNGSGDLTTAGSVPGR